MTGNSLYNLTWGEYGTSLISAVQYLRCQGELVDVTLAAGGRTFSAHKVVLCAASPFLLDLLKSTTCKHPVVMLAGVQATDLEALLEFVYRGEVSIDPNQLPSLLQAAHCLNIQGLASLNSESIQHQPVVRSVLDISKSTVESVAMQDTPTVSEEEVPVKKKKRAKRQLKNAPPSPPISKWPKLYVQLDSTDNINSNDQEGSTATWPHQMNIVNVSSTSANIEALPMHAPLLVHNLPANSSPAKTRGASDQPGACPLCGAMLRQARNLRRHLLTSCKYRVVGGPQQSSTVQSSHIDNRESETHLHELQTLSVQNLDNSEHLDSKEVLTPISCPELLSTNNSIMASSNL